MNGLKDTEPVRLYLYGIVGPILAILVVIGVVQEASVQLWVALAAAILAVPIAGEAARSIAFAPATVDRIKAGDELIDP